MGLPILENVHKSPRHSTFYLSCGPKDGAPVIFCHGYPELAISWTEQLQTFGNLGFRAIAPDMRGYGSSTIHPRKEDYALEHAITDMIELLDGIGAEKAVWVGHDMGTSVVWAMGRHHPNRCHGIVNLGIPYIPAGFAPDNLIPLTNRKIYPADRYPAAQWDYWLHYIESFDEACASFDSDVGAFVRWLYRSGRSGTAADKEQPLFTATTRVNGGWFGKGKTAPDMPRDPAILSEEDEHKYTAALKRNGFAAPTSWYMNSTANIAFAASVKDKWHLKMPVLYVHQELDFTIDGPSSPLLGPMREYCANLTEDNVVAGHWVSRENPADLNAVLAKWLSAQVPALWTRRSTDH